MKRIVIFVVAALCFAGTTMAQEHRNQRRESHSEKRENKMAVQDSLVQSKWSGAHISFEKTKHNFGEVHRKGGDLTVKFRYVNDGTEPLVITRIATSCTCIRTSHSRRPLDVGDSGEIELIYEPHKMEEGLFHKVVQVYSNSADGMHLLTVSGRSVENKK